MWTRRVSCQEWIQSDPIVTVIVIEIKVGSDIEDTRRRLPVETSCETLGILEDSENGLQSQPMGVK